MFSKKLLRALGAMLAALLLLTAACGGDDDDDSGDDTGPTATAVDGGDDTGDDDDDDASGDDEDDDSGDDDSGDDDDSGGGGDDGFDACDLLSDDEVADALDAEVNHESRGADGCDYTAVEDTEIKFLAVDIILDDEEDARSTYEATALAFGEDAITEVDGIGDEAIVSEEIGLEVLQDDDYIRVDIYGLGFDQDEIDIETPLAELVLDRLP